MARKKVLRRGYVRKDGTVVADHYAFVNVSDTDSEAWIAGAASDAQAQDPLSDADDMCGGSRRRADGLNYNKGGRPYVRIQCPSCERIFSVRAKKHKHYSEDVRGPYYTYSGLIPTHRSSTANTIE